MKSYTKHRLVVTGGHHNSALVVAQSLMNKGHSVLWIGHKRSAQGDSHESAEFIEVTASKIPFHNLTAGKFTFHNGLTNIINIPLGFFRAYSLLRQLKPQAVISFGGYLGVAVSVAALLQAIPIYLHEQTLGAGLANKFVGFFAKRIFLTWENSIAKFPPQKSVVVGLPLRSSIINSKSINIFKNNLPTIIVMGGKQGSHSINTLIFDHLEALLEKYNIIHQTGMSSATGDYENAISLRDILPPHLSRRYQPRGYIGENEIGSILRSVDLYIGRSGAHITYELALLGIRSVLVPYLITHEMEQLLSARLLVKIGVGTILGESELSYPKLQEAITIGLKLKATKQNLVRNADELMIDSILSDLGT